MHSFIRYIPLFCPFLWNQLCFVLLFIGNVPENVHKHKNRKREKEREREKILSESIRWIYVNIGNRNENRFMEQLWQEIIEWMNMGQTKSKNCCSRFFILYSVRVCACMCVFAWMEHENVFVSTLIFFEKKWKKRIFFRKFWL